MATTLEAAGVTLDPERLVAYFNGKRVSLTAREAEVASVFLTNPDRVITRQELRRRVWGAVDATSRVVDAYVSRVRAKLKTMGHPGISAVRMRGYLILQPPEAGEKDGGS